VNFTTANFYGTGWSKSSLPLEEFKSCPDNNPPGSSP
jgi:hypothetical protein